MTIKRGLTGVLIVGLLSLLLIGVLWAVSREAPSASRDPNMTPLRIERTRTPTPVASTSGTWLYDGRRNRGSTIGSSASASSMKASAVITIKMPGGSTHHQYPT